MRCRAWSNVADGLEAEMMTSILRLFYRRRNRVAASALHYAGRLDCAVDYVIRAEDAGCWRSLAELAAIGKYRLDRMACLAAAAFFFAMVSTSAEARSAACIRHGVPAVCRSAAIEKQAKAIVLRQCKRCRSSDVTDWIYSLQMNRGPYASAPKLARDVLQQVR